MDRSGSTAAEDANNFADAMLGVALFIDFVLAIAFGSLIGMIFAVVSIRKIRRWSSIGTAAFLFNAIPACFVLYKILTTW